jgi:hypothetical protein
MAVVQSKPSWIFLTEVITPGSPDFVSPADRITSFKNPASEN